MNTLNRLAADALECLDPLNWLSWSLGAACWIYDHPIEAAGYAMLAGLVATMIAL